MKILQLGKQYPIVGGVETVMFDILEGVSARGIRCDMLCASHDKKSHYYQINDNASIFCASTLVFLFCTSISVKMIFQLKKKCNSYDIIHLHCPDPMAAFALYLSGYKGHVILHWHSDILKQKFLLKFFLPLQKWITNRAEYIIGTSPVYLSESPFLDKCQNKCISIPIGIDKIQSNGVIIDGIKKKYVGKKIVFSIGRLIGYKGYKYLVDSARFLPDDYVILIGGSGPLSAELSLQITNSGLSDKVKLLGRLSNDELCAYYQACDVFCLSSIWKTEAFAIVQIEAMSCGKPIIATNISGSGVPWVNKDGVSGINVNPENAEALSSAITKILSDEILYKKLSQGALSRYNDLFRKDIMIDKVLSLYKSIIS